MEFGRKLAAVVTAVGFGGVAMVGVAPTAHAAVLDREQKRCGTALVTAKLERDSSEQEVDIEVYSDRRGERWRLVIKDASGATLHTINRKTNREGEFDVWRYISGSIKKVSIDVRGPNGQACTLQLSA